MELEEKFIESNKIFDGHLLQVYCDRVLLPNGKEAQREYIKHPGAVAVVPIREDGKIVLVRQFRYPTGQLLLEVPAGKLDEGELPEQCAIRELTEETGLVAGSLKKLAAIYTTPGFTDEMIHLYVAVHLQEAKQKLDEDEFLKVEAYSREEVAQMLAEGKINDAKSMLALFLAGICR
jgi:ADP-ribose pyrophosphatase